MTIKRGQPWGDRGILPPHLPVAATDAEAAALLNTGCREFVISGGDMWRTVGGSATNHSLTDTTTSTSTARDIIAGPPDNQERTVLRLDSMEASFTQGGFNQHRCIFSHAVFAARRSQIRPHFLARVVDTLIPVDTSFVMNAQFLGPLDVAPRSHPNDGRIEVLTVPKSLPWRQRRQFQYRLRTGTHLPHPQISMRSVANSWSPGRPGLVMLDGVHLGLVTDLNITIVPDSITVWI